MAEWLVERGGWEGSKRGKGEGKEGEGGLFCFEKDSYFATLSC